MQSVTYNVFYKEDGKEKTMKVVLTSRNHSVPMAINKFKKTCGGIRNMKKNKIAIVSCFADF